MSISGVGGANSNWSVPQQSNSGSQPASSQPSRLQIPEDSLEISETAQMMANLQTTDGTSPERAELIARLQAEIAQGTYDTDEKLEIAFAKLLQQSGEE